jgi:hypothetical protein
MARVPPALFAPVLMVSFEDYRISERNATATAVFRRLEPGRRLCEGVPP